MIVFQEVISLKIREECYKIYCDEFGEDSFAKELFDKCFQYCRYLTVEKRIVSILFLLPCCVMLGKEKIPAKYVFAVTTKRDMRGKGYAIELLNSIKNDELLFLKPSNASLIDFYKKLGYITFKAKYGRAGEKKVILEDEFFDLAENYGRFDSEEYTAMYYYKNTLELDGLDFPYVME